MVNAKKLELIEELKQLRIEKGMTYQEIADKTEENGAAVSLSTIKQVFSARFQHDHDYNKVLKPIADVLMPPVDDGDLEIRILQTRLELKDEIISQLQTRVDKKEEKHREREQFLKEQLMFYKEQIRFKDSQIQRHIEVIDRKDAIIRKYMFNEEG